ncbi:DMT family transporter [Geothrix sp. PMB-07]|uniref:DMT family transporter n=1 Tax=Geothrix sp. PMB-07 TaxID=3068640 RepID=UPI002741D69E|nr:DMT family transporter [Geothrix sp. PMB-07]WLT30255.1 DMT family transporter [Geothrix sp. PMB-07]
MRSLKAMAQTDGLLLLVAIIWGFAFVAQRNGMEAIGPFAFGAARFALGALSLIPLLILQRKREARKGVPSPRLSFRQRSLWALGAGTVLFVAASLQQVGLVHTTAGNAGFITCLYVVLVPLAGRFLGRPAGFHIWLGAGLALGGLYILSIGTGLKLAPGDSLELLGAFFWTLHILIIAHVGARIDTLELSIGQFATCATLSFFAALAREPHAFRGLPAAGLPILYGGLLSVGVAYTLQIVAQRRAHPAHASIILSMEALFAAVGGVLLLHEPLSLRLILGGGLMLAGMAASQLAPKKAA